MRYGLVGLMFVLLVSSSTWAERDKLADAASGNGSPGKMWRPVAQPSELRMSVSKSGAKGDGKADDTAAIQAAVNRVGQAGGGVVYFPNGVYKVSDSIVVRNNRVTLEGEGWGAEIRMVKHPKRVIVIEGSRDNVVRNLKLTLGVANVDRNDEDEGIYVTDKASHFLIEGILGNKKGIMVRGGVSDGTIRNNTIQNTLADGIHLTGGSRNLLVTGNDLIGTGDDAIAVVSYEDQIAQTQSVVIVGNRIRHSYARGIAFVGGYQVDIRDNVIDGTSSSGILVDRDRNVRSLPAVQATIEGNTVNGAGTFAQARGNQFGIEIASGAAYVSISGNKIKGSESRGMSVSAKGTEIRRNESSNNRDSGLQVDADGCIVIGNLFENNGTFGLFAIDSHRLRISGNRLADNNVRNAGNIDNFVLNNSNSSIVTGNVSVETRANMQIERAFQWTGSCKDTVFDKNVSQGTRQGTVAACTP